MVLQKIAEELMIKGYRTTDCSREFTKFGRIDVIGIFFKGNYIGTLWINNSAMDAQEGKTWVLECSGNDELIKEVGAIAISFNTALRVANPSGQ